MFLFNPFNKLVINSFDTLNRFANLRIEPSFIGFYYFFRKSIEYAFAIYPFFILYIISFLYFNYSGSAIYEAYLGVKANKECAGIDGQGLSDFELNLKLYKL